MGNFNLTIIRPKGFLHSSGFLEVRDSLAWSLTQLGHEAILTENTFSASNSRNIIFGAELLNPDTSDIPPQSIIYNLEQSSHPNMSRVRALAARAECLVWDFSTSNKHDWKQVGIDAIHVPIGYTPNLTRIPKPDTQDIDVLFYGWMTQRRVEIIKQLRATGLNVYATDQVYGGGRDNLISRSKVVLNVHHDGRDMFEIVRVSYLWANRKCVVSEVSSDDNRGFPYSGLVQACRVLATDYIPRSEREREAFDEFSQKDYTRTIRAALGGDGGTGRRTGLKSLGVRECTRAGSSPAPPTNLSEWHRRLTLRYDRGCQSGDMRDFLPWLRQHSHGKVLEIGVRDGASTSALLLGVEENGGTVYSLDIQDCSTIFGPAGHPQWRFRMEDSKNLPRLAEPIFDMILIDGDHSREGFLSDLNKCWYLLKPGGILCCHDISPMRTCEEFAGDWPSKAVGEEYFKFIWEGLMHEELPGENGMGVIYK